MTVTEFARNPPQKPEDLVPPPTPVNEPIEESGSRSDLQVHRRLPALLQRTRLHKSAQRTGSRCVAHSRGMTAVAAAQRALYAWWVVPGAMLVAVGPPDVHRPICLRPWGPARGARTSWWKWTGWPLSLPSLRCGRRSSGFSKTRQCWQRFLRDARESLLAGGTTPTFRRDTSGSRRLDDQSPSAERVTGPMTPSGRRCFFAWNCRTSVSVKCP